MSWGGSSRARVVLGTLEQPTVQPGLRVRERGGAQLSLLMERWRRLIALRQARIRLWVPASDSG